LIILTGALQLYRKYLMFQQHAENLRDDVHFTTIMTLSIIMAGILVGVETQMAVPTKVQNNVGIDAANNFVLAMFTIEIVVKLVAMGPRPLSYFKEGWNCFDFFIVFACYLFMSPALPNLGSIIAMLRLLRLLRVLKLAKQLPQLRVIIEALISGFGSITFVFIILFIWFYIFAIIGVMLFSKNDPGHMGNLHLTLLSLFRAATYDAWSDLV
jgi:voltage-gated sodium channel